MNMKALVVSALVATSAVAGISAFADNDYAEYQAQRSAKISYEQAGQIAVNVVGGGTVTDIDFEYKYGKAFYEVEVRNGHTEYDIDIDANTGAVLKKKVDY